jgi:glutamate racemase
MKKAIGVFDSGLGGLTAVKELSALMPRENIIYLGDTARVPYGSRSAETLIRFAKQDLEFFFRQNVKAVLVACGTISSVALPVLKEMCPVFIEGVVSPAAKRAAQITKNGKIAVIATNASIHSGAYSRELKAINNGFTVIEKACPMFVPIVENGYFGKDNPVAKLIVKDYLSEIKASGADTVILGCTHYPILRPLIEEFLGGGIALVDSGMEAAKEVCEHIKNAHEEQLEGTGKNTYYVTDEPSGFTALAELFLNKKIEEVKKVSLDDDN